MRTVRPNGWNNSPSLSLSFSRCSLMRHHTNKQCIAIRWTEYEVYIANTTLHILCMYGTGWEYESTINPLHIRPILIRLLSAMERIQMPECVQMYVIFFLLTPTETWQRLTPNAEGLTYSRELRQILVVANWILYNSGDRSSSVNYHRLLLCTCTGE